MKLYLSFAALLLVLAGCSSTDSSSSKQEITVAAAASLQDALTTIADNFEQQHPNTQINLSFGSSGTLQNQIEHGAPVDIFAAASEKNMDALAQQQLVLSDSRRILARGELVLIAPDGSTLTGFNGLKDSQVKAISIGGPGVPAGDYGRQTLEHLQLKSTLQPKLVAAKDVRAVLNQVASGNAEAGLVYRSDALTSPQVKIVAVAPPKAHRSIVYPIAIVKSSQQQTLARQFIDYTTQKPAQAVLARAGFAVNSK